MEKDAFEQGIHFRTDCKVLARFYLPTSNGKGMEDGWGKNEKWRKLLKFLSNLQESRWKQPGSYF